MGFMLGKIGGRYIKIDRLLRKARLRKCLNLRRWRLMPREFRNAD